jgi:hypothetical protein
MVALNVTAWFTADPPEVGEGCGVDGSDDASVTDVTPEPTSCATGAEVLLAKFESPEV